ncbi:28S ribosomal protein S18a, mitochondrial [Pseudolycoriella hygida]|uniref:28S ribosomal protein S18a, mitochondrial n=1 Tax=Pseudolycoriella hygida TaxID=35572 RepID=A0A9Q0RW39_9DIPT|nr:28S ribosomal protein S18a, mitochondrial [Pseudolycoriella hygida]
MALFKIGKSAFSSLQWAQRQISTSSSLFIKQIIVKEDTNSLTISGQIVESPREHLLLKEVNEPNFCPKCTLGLDIKHTDVLILSQYLRSDGCLLPRRITGLCTVQQKRISKLVAMAQKAGLMANMAPANSKRNPKKRLGYKKYNKYFDETTIKYCNRVIE